MLLIVVVNLIPLAAVVIAWLLELRRSNVTGRLRRIAFRTGLGIASVGALLLLGFVLYSLTVHKGWEGHDFAAHAFWIPSAAAAIVSLPLSLFGRELPRLMGIGSSLSLLVLLYYAGLATSY
jgi:hypothetical protein